MGLEEIIKNIEIDTKAKEKKTVEEAVANADQIKDQAFAESSKFLSEANAKADAEAAQMSMRELSRANIEAKGVYQKAVNDAIVESLSSLEGNLDGYLKSADYTKLIGKLATIAMNELGNGCTLLVQSRDISKVKIAGKAKVAEATEEFIGGLRGVSADNTMSVDYSIEKLIDSLQDKIAVKLLSQMKA